MTTYVFDASAILEYFFNGKKAPIVRDLLRQAGKGEVRFLISSVQMGEIYYAVAQRLNAAKAAEALEKLEELGVEDVMFITSAATRAAHLRLESGLAYADSVAASLALENKAVLVTADPDFGKVEKKTKIIWVK